MPTPTSEQLGIWIACFLLLADFYMRYKSHESRGRTTTQITPQPLLVQEHTGQCAGHKEMANRVDQSRTELADDRRKSDESRQRLYAEIKGLRLEFKDDNAEVYRRIESIRLELSEKIEGMESRIIATLKNTGAI